MTEPGRQRDLDDLEARLATAKARHEPDPRGIATSALAASTRYAMEIAVATVVGGAIGWQLDCWLGTKPWLAILFLLLGLAAGFTNLLRAVNREAAQMEAAEQAKAAEVAEQTKAAQAAGQTKAAEAAGQTKAAQAAGQNRTAGAAKAGPAGDDGTI